MLKLANVGKDDVFLDLGSGWSQNLIIALTEFDVKYAIGFERNKKRYRKAVQRIKEWGLSDRCAIYNEDFMKALKSKKDRYGIGKATVVFYGLSADKEIFDLLKGRLKEGCRLLYYYLGIFPEIMPDKSNFPFFVSTVPFKETVSEDEWLMSIVQKQKSSINKEESPSAEELWAEIRHDYDVYGDRSDVANYQKWMSKVLKGK
jgi:hypothetical protein